MGLLIREINLVAFSHNLFRNPPMLYSEMNFELKKNSSILFHIFWKYNSLWCVLWARIFKSKIKNDFSGVRKAPVNHPKKQKLIRHKCDFPESITTTNKLLFFVPDRIGVFLALGKCLMCKSSLAKGIRPDVGLHPQQSFQRQSFLLALSSSLTLHLYWAFLRSEFWNEI